jgi:hypothetical protein
MYETYDAFDFDEDGNISLSDLRSAAEQLELNFDAAQALHNFVAQFHALHTFLDVNNVGYVDEIMCLKRFAVALVFNQLSV